MADVNEHYDEVLSNIYSWMCGGFETAIQRNTDFFNAHRLHPRGSGIAIDLGAGCGFQSIPLARTGYSVTAMDLSAPLLEELKQNARGLKIKTVQGDMTTFDRHIDTGVELMVCMTDTFLHLDSKESVISLFQKSFSALEAGGKLILTFRDLTHELKNTDRFLPVKNDEDIIFTCFLEYEPETVKVHDLVYQRIDSQWKLSKSFYRKLRLSEEWVTRHLSECGFGTIEATEQNGLVTIIGSKE